MNFRAHRLLKKRAQFVMAYAKNSRRGVPRSGGVGDEIPREKLLQLHQQILSINLRPGAYVYCFHNRGGFGVDSAFHFHGFDG